VVFLAAVDDARAALARGEGRVITHLLVSRAEADLDDI
jgi:hypothetical protein